MKADIVIVGCGDLGSALAQQCQLHDLSVLGLRRHPDAQEFACAFADISQPASLSVIVEAQPKVLVYCVAATEQTDANYQQQYVQGLQNTLQACQALANQPLIIFISSTRMYGQDSELALDEQSMPLHSDFGGQRLMQAEALLQPLDQAVVLRLTGIYGPGRNRMLQWASNPAVWPEQNKWTNRIHRDDAVGFILHLIQAYLRGEAIQRLYIVTDSQPAPMYEVLSYFAEQMGVSQTFADRPLSGGRFFSNQRMLNSGYQLQYPSYRSGGYPLPVKQS